MTLPPSRGPTRGLTEGAILAALTVIVAAVGLITPLVGVLLAPLPIMLLVIRWGLRIAVLPGGCPGFRYSLNIEDKPGDDDVVIESAGVRCFVDGFSAQYLNGVTLDYKSNFQESGFAFENPNATGGCGCGSSFTV